ncbi:hypothetical protein ASD8599_01742 [Ascidiaceihabitans donghaensis]|uniref:ArsR family transcriptional regulator n=1 Tax=Ascidiaceihabitans donghaensis TaxID=1510460 RepID=A0A2R8BDA4_9RHOB|nr:hypothetical protein [Ascidiaceihabitans donghaensis]SPH21001.1 hypothetical protein ASD8599_01742 [Ascidiaceihabitans donghaensis]
MSDYAKQLRQHRRLTILKLLHEIPEYTSNASLLTEGCNRFGVTTSRAQMSTELAWLSEQGFVALSGTADFQVAKATQSGVDVALGRARHPEVQRPGPDA